MEQSIIIPRMGACMNVVMTQCEVEVMKSGGAFLIEFAGKRRLLYYGFDNEFHYINYRKNGKLGNGRFTFNPVRWGRGIKLSEHFVDLEMDGRK